MTITQLLTIFILAGLCVPLAQISQAGVMLTFDPHPGNDKNVNAAYGDRVQSAIQDGFSYGVIGSDFTPNVVTSYNFASGHWDLEYGDLVNVLYNNESSTSGFSLTFTADPGFNVLLHGFDLAGWQNTDYVIPRVQVLDSVANPLFTQNNVAIQGDLNGVRHTSFDFSIPLRSQSLTIIFDDSNTWSNIGIDNIHFSQIAAVPEPSSFLIALLAAAPAILNRRTKQ